MACWVYGSRPGGKKVWNPLQGFLLCAPRFISSLYILIWMLITGPSQAWGPGSCGCRAALKPASMVPCLYRPCGTRWIMCE